MTNPRVAILMGSDSDFGIMDETCKVFDDFGVAYEVLVSSAHRTPERTIGYVEAARGKGIQCIICGAGAAAHLAGVVAASTTLPVIGVPIDATALNGVDALYATVMMPGGIPVATMAIGKAGAKNAALYALAMFSTTDKAIEDKLAQYRKDMQAKVIAKSEALQAKLANR